MSERLVFRERNMPWKQGYGMQRGRAKKPARAQREDYAEQRELKSLSSHGAVFFHKTLPGLPIYPVLPAGFIRDIKEALLFSSMTRSCVASVAVSPYNPSRNQNLCPGVCFHVYFPRLVARKILMESEAGTPVTIRFWFIFDYRELAGIRLFFTNFPENIYSLVVYTKKIFLDLSHGKNVAFYFRTLILYEAIRTVFQDDLQSLASAASDIRCSKRRSGI